MSLRMLWIVVWVGLYLIALEVGLELRGTSRGFDSLLFGSHQRVGSQKSEGAAAPDAIAILGNGAEEQAKTGRYWIASSSHAEDTYLSHDVIFPTNLERLLRRSGIHAVVINASHAGMDIPANTSDLQVRGPVLKPDVVILYQMSLTINTLSKKLLSVADPRLLRVDKTRDDRRQGKNANWAVSLIEQTAIYAQLKGNLTSRLATQRVLSDTLGKQGELEFESMIDDFLSTVRRLGATPVLCTFATSHIRKDLPQFPDSVTTLMFKYNSYLSLEGWVGTIERFNMILRQIAEREEVVLIDLEAELGGRHELFRDYVHFTPEGHAAVAKVLHQALVLHTTETATHSVMMR